MGAAMTTSTRLLLLVALCLAGSSSQGAAESGNVVHYGGGSAGWDAWRTVLDGVMGGKSSGTTTVEGDSLRFAGNINIDGGGFSSIVRYFRQTVDMSSYAGFRLAVDTLPADTVPLGMHFALRDADSFWTHLSAFSLHTGPAPATVQEIFIPMDSFTRADWRGMRCTRSGSCQMNPSKIVEMSLYVLFQEGEFDITIHGITAVTDPGQVSHSSPVPMNMTHEGAMSFLRGTIQRGSSLYNYNYPELCAAVYESALETLSVATGMPGELNETISKGLNEADKVSGESPEQHAWALRQVVDATMAIVQTSATGNSSTLTDEDALMDYPMLLDESSAAAAMDTSGASPTSWRPRGLSAMLLGSFSFLACAIATRPSTLG